MGIVPPLNGAERIEYRHAFTRPSTSQASVTDGVCFPETRKRHALSLVQIIPLIGKMMLANAADAATADPRRHRVVTVSNPP
ncbi:hypothetical protein GCM10009000_032730 [Halobacterium noricense]